MLNNEKGRFFCIPVQYIGDFHIGGFDFSGGLIVIGDYEIPLKKDDVNISVYLKDNADLDGGSVTGFDLVYMEERGSTILSKMDEPLAAKQSDDDDEYIHYYIFIDRFLSGGELEKINSEFKMGNVYSRFEIWYDLIIDNEPQLGSGMLDDFELYDGVAIDPVWFPPNLNFFKAMYL